MRSALGGVNVIKNLELEPGSGGGSGTFECPSDFDYKTKLDALASTNEHLAGWSEGD